MNVFNVRSYSTIPLGKQGENTATQIRFPFVNEFRELYGEGVFQLVHQRRTDHDPYAVNISIDGDSVVWNITNTDVAICGIGKCELVYIVNNTIAKSITFSTKVIDSISHVGGTPPEPWESWVEEVLQAGANAVRAAEDASESADEAEGYAEEIKNLTVSSHALNHGEEPTVTKTGGDGEPYNFDFGIPNVPFKPYVSLSRLSRYLYEVSFNTLPEYRELNASFASCSSIVSDGKLYRNLDWKYDHNVSFHVKTAGFEGMAFLDGLTDISLDDDLIGQLPYHVVDGVNEYGIMVSTHVLFNDWYDWDAHGYGDISLTLLPYIVLSRVKSMESLIDDLDGVLDNLHATAAMDAAEYLIQVLVTDGTTSYVLAPKIDGSGDYEAIDISVNPKLTNFRWVSEAVVDRVDLQDRPTGVERWNSMTPNLSDLRFTKAYETPSRLSEFIGIDYTTKYSTDTELKAIYDRAHALYLVRERDGSLWQTMHSVVYSPNGIEHLWVQEDWDKDYIAQSGGGGEGTSDHRLLINRDSANQHPISAIEGLETALSGKQGTISDLAAIRAGAALGARSVQTETDPTVPSWAKQANKPSYSKSDVGLGNVDNVRQYSVNNPPPYPVTSVNGETGTVTVTPAKIGAATEAYVNNATTDMATQTWVNGKGFITASDIPVLSVNGKTGTVTLTAADLGIGSVFDLKGSKPTVAALPTTGNKIGDVWYVVDESVGYIWLNDGTENRWEQLGLSVDLSNYVTSEALTAALTSYVTKVAGKGLSTNDFTDAYKTKLDSAITSLIGYATESWVQQQGYLQSVPSTYRTAAEQDVIDASKLTEPSSGLAVGKYFRIASIDEDGHAVLEAVDAPGPSYKSGTVNPSSSTIADYIGQLYINTVNNTQYQCTGIDGNTYAWSKCVYNNAYNGYATSGYPVIIGYGASKSMFNYWDAVAIGENSYASNRCVAIGTKSYADTLAVALGSNVKCSSRNSIGIGYDITVPNSTFQVWAYKLLDFDTGLIPHARMHNVKSALDAVAVAGAEYYLGEQSTVSIVLPSTAEVGQLISVVWYNGATAATLSITGTVLDVNYTPSANSRSEINALWDGTYWCVKTTEDAVPEVTE